MKVAGSRRPLVLVMLFLTMLCVLTALGAGALTIYKYDANGNRLSETITIAVSGTTGVWGCFNWNVSGGARWGS
jgi:YD repeat-containing protein